MELPEALQGETWTQQIALEIIPILVWCAENGTKITYGGLNKELVARGLGHNVHAAAYKNPAGAIGDALQETSEDWLESIPPLNAIIVSQSTGMPGSKVSYYLLRYKNPRSRRINLSDADRFALAEEVIDEVQNYGRWQELLKLYGLKPIKGKVANAFDVEDTTPLKLPKRKPPGGSGESDEHKQLKIFVKDHPMILKTLGKFLPGENEFPLYSGDRLDVHFENKQLRIGVEVKAGNAGESELTRGIFQCVKYRAVMRAEQRALNQLPNARAVLVTPLTLSKEQRKLAKRLSVPVIERLQR